MQEIHCQEYMQWISRTPGNEGVNDLAKSSEKHLYGVGDRGTFFQSKDYGNTWKVKSKMFDDLISLKKVHFWSTTDGIIIRDGGAFNQNVMLTKDGGESWKSPVIKMPDLIYDMYCFGDSSAILCGVITKPYLYSTHNRGKTWSIDSSYANYYLRNIKKAVNDSLLFLIGSHSIESKIYSSSNNGAAWKEFSTLKSIFLNKLSFLNSKIGVAASSKSLFAAGPSEIKLHLTTDGGVSWRTVFQISDYFTFNDIQFINSTTVLAASSKGLYVSFDAGNTWSKSDVNYGVSKILILANNDIIVGGISSLFKSSDNGKTWIKMSRQFNYGGGSIDAVGDNNLFLVGDDLTGSDRIGLIAKSIDGGKSWENKWNSPWSMWFSDVDFINNNKGIVLSDIAHITTDGGDSWKGNSLPIYSFLKRVDFMNENLAVIVGFSRSNTSQGVLFRTADGGNTWENISINSPALYSVMHPGKNKWIAVGENGTILISTDSGLNWNAKTSNTANTLTNVFFVDNLVGFCVGFNGTLIKTSDGGETWLNVKTGTNKAFQGLAFRNNYGIVVGDEGTILTTTDNGVSWNFQKVLVLSLQDVIFTDNFCYITGVGGALLRFALDTTNVIKPEIPYTIRLEQNYPNPFNPITTIAYSIPESGNIEIKVYDVLGREVETLISEVKVKGNYQINFDGSKLSSGVYIYRMITPNYSQTKKMILLK